MENVKITIITVCYNAEETIEKTISSVMRQTYQNIEYIIIDGNSSDNTVSIIENYANVTPIKWISEEDLGIYDAMNKGVEAATGDYIQFLNAGDTLFHKEVISEIVEAIVKSGADVIYGNIMYCYEDGNEVIRKYGKLCGKKIYFLTGDCINHQGIFAKKKWLSDEKFNIEYSICADREWMMRILKKKAKFSNTGSLICNYSLDKNSASIKEKVKYQQEARRCIVENFPRLYIIFDLFEFCRNNKVLSQVLHTFYKIIYIRKA